MLPRYSWWNTTPSLMKSTRPAWLAARVECVTISSVWPARLISRNRCSSCAVALESSAPVGSSASTSFGPVNSARATAARCFCPPDTSDGYLSRISAMPSCLAMGARRVAISEYPLCERTSVKSPIFH